MSDIEERIMTFPLKTMGADVRGLRCGYFVAVVSEGMNDREQYARLFAKSPDLLAALRELSAAVDEALASEFLKPEFNLRHLEKALSVAKRAAGAATENWESP